MRTTKISIYPDVKERLEAEREREKEQPHYYEGVKEITRLRSPGLDHIQDAIINNPEWDGCNMLETIKINEIDVRVDVEQKVTLVVKSQNQV